MAKEIQNEKSLIRRVQQGDQEACRQLIDGYKRLVAHIVFRMVPRTTDREDICQDVFLKVFSGIHEFRFDSKLSTWIATIAYHRCLNFLQKKKALLYDDHSRGQSMDSVRGGQAPDQILVNHDVNSRLHEAIRTLDLPYRTILTLYHLEEMSYAEIAEIMGMPVGTIKSYLFRARKQLKQMLHEQYEREEIWAST